MACAGRASLIATGTGTPGYALASALSGLASPSQHGQCEGGPNALSMPGRSQMTQAVAREQDVGQSVSLAALFTAFLTVSLCGFAGGLVWARPFVVENRRWISDREFADIVSLCQFMPGPNIVGIAVCVGAKMRGVIGAIAAICGFLVIPWTVGLSLGVL